MRWEELSKNQPGYPVQRLFEWFGELGIFCGHFFRSLVSPPYEGRELIRQMDEVGSKSFPLVVLAGAAMGVVMTLHTRESLIRFGAKSFLPAVIILAIIKETGPIITALVLAGRAGAGIGSELGSMKVTEQIDPIDAGAVDPYRYLVATRVVACALMLPLLTVAADFSGIIMGWLANTMMEPISLKAFVEEGFKRADFADVLPTTGRAAVFGLLIGIIGCFQGMRTTGGTEGVGKSATSAVVLASLFIILADVVLVRMIMLLDEPTAGLDPVTAGEINDLFLDLQEDFSTTSILVTHDLNCARKVSNRVALLHKGILIVEGAFEDLEQSEHPFVLQYLKQAS